MHHGEAVAPDAVATPQPGKKPHLQHHHSDVLPVETDANGLVVPRP
jgi:hypothetical protein